MSFSTISDLITYLREEEVEYLDIRFTNVPGTEHALTVPAEALTEESAAEGFAFDGSSVAGVTSVRV